MAIKLSKYLPARPGNDPLTGATVTTFLPGDRYKIYESGGDVYVFVTAVDPAVLSPTYGKEVTRCSRFSAHGTMTLDIDATALLKKFEKE